MLKLSTRLGLLLLTFLLACLPVAVGVYVNETASYQSTTQYRVLRCTRYCEAHACPHITAANSPAYLHLKPLYRATVAGLSAGGPAWYAAANIGVYVVLVPLLLVWLTHGFLRNVALIRQLKTLRRG